MRHQAAPGGVFVRKNGVPEFLRRKQDEILRQPREMCGDAGEREQIVKREVPVADRIEAVCRDAGKAQLARNGHAVYGKGASRKRPRAHRTSVSARGGRSEACNVPRKRLDMREQKVRQQNRLRALHVGHASHRHTELCFRLFE